MYIVTPDYLGKATKESTDTNSFISKVHALYPDATVMPVINGMDSAEMHALADAAATDWLQPLVCTDNKRGMVGACLLAYDTILAEDPEPTIVKLDTGEHDPAYIGAVVAAAERAGVAVGDLTFTDETLVPGTYDYWIHREVFPTLYGQFSDGRLRLTCAHGFQAYVRPVGMIVDMAKKIMHEVERELGNPVGWGLDGAMAIAGIAHTEVEIVPVPAQSKRDRKIDKINDQLGNHMQMLVAAKKVWCR